MGDGRAEGSSAIGDGGQAPVSLKPYTGMHIFESLKLEGSYVVIAMLSGKQTHSEGQCR